MRIFLIGYQVLNKFNLPTEVRGDYWISYYNNGYEKKIINVYGENQNWQIESNEEIKIINPEFVEWEKGQLRVTQSNGIIMDKVVLKEYQMYYLCVGNFQNIYVLYCLPKCERNITCLDTGEMQEISIGNGLHNHISYHNNLVKSIHARLNYVGNKWRIEDLGGAFGVFINGEVLHNDIKELKNGDVIFIMGLIIIVIGRKLYINNPLNQVIWSTMHFKLVKEKPTVYASIYNTATESQDINIYSDKDYFYRSPRIMSKIEPEKLKIDPPPTLRAFEEKSLILTLGTSLVMGITMLVTLISSISSMVSGNSYSITRIATSVSMLFGILVMPMITRKVQKSQSLKNEERRQQRYKEYLNSKTKLISNIIKKQKNILINNYPSTEDCVKNILDRNNRLWERRSADKDFLTVRLGTGDIPVNVEIQYPEDKFTIEEDYLVDMARDIVEESRFIKDAPITFSFLEKNISAIIGRNTVEIENFIQHIILQLTALHSYQELKLVFLVKDNYIDWDYVKILPHVWTNEREKRFFANSYSDMQEISIYLNDQFMRRMEKEDETYQAFQPYYIIITDDYEKVENLNIIHNILKSTVNKGFSILCISNQLAHLPDECESFIYLNGEESEVYESEISSSNTIQFAFDNTQTFFVDKIAKSIANIPIKYITSNEETLKSSFGFLEMFNVGRIEQLNILDRWNSNDSTKSLKAQIGLDVSGMPIYLDIHEKFHGPHGIIAGSTGSGKSEFIITYILSLAVNYSPKDVAFVLIDYKGGGLAGAFKKRDIQLPHLVGTITNIDTNGLERSLVSIKSELTRRQIIFNEARELIDEGTIDIYKYQKLYKQGIVKKQYHIY